MNSLIVKGWEAEIESRHARLSEALRANGADAMIISTNVNLYYASSRVIAGYVYITANGEVHYFVRRPVGLEGKNVHYIRKPEQITEILEEKPNVLAMEYDMAYGDVLRLQSVFSGATFVNASAILRGVRSVKSAFEIELMKRSGESHVNAYKAIPAIFKEGMSDVEFQIELEHRLRKEGCLGIFRISGQSMELFMGNILAGDNADNPAPYDFAMGGAGADQSLPVGANGTAIKQGMSLMVDACGNFTGYMTDMTRSFKVGEVGELAEKAHRCSVDICRAFTEKAKAGVAAKDMYDMAASMATEAGLEAYFMGHMQKAGFVGHGVGIEINESPVLAARSKDIFVEGNVVALEPKFVIPGVGAVGIENTYVIKADGVECITKMDEELQQLL